MRFRFLLRSDCKHKESAGIGRGKTVLLDS